MKKTMSLIQLAANRRNARKSTGPKSAAGKAVSKFNALKHGLLAQSVVVRGHQFEESTSEFKKLCQAYYLHLAPVGPLEQMLVGQIVTAAWRLRRAPTAESGEIALSVDTGCWERENQNPLPLLLGDIPVMESLVTRLMRSVRGCRYLIHCLRGVREDVDRNGKLTDAGLKDFKWSLRDDPNDMVKKLEQFRVWLSANPEKLKPEALRTRHKEDVMNYLNRKIREFEFCMDLRQEREDAEEQARQTAAVLPSAEVLEKILRYETALGRQLFLAMNQLERLQRQRLGENIPAPLTMDISAKA